MDVHEKLVELLLQEDGVCEPSDCKYCGVKGSCGYYRIADRLIANGVTVQEWISVDDKLPEMPPDKIAEGYVQMQVLVWCDKGRQCAWFQVDTKTFYDQPGLFGTEVDGITHWMPLPQPPKGE